MPATTPSPASQQFCRKATLAPRAAAVRTVEAFAKTCRNAPTLLWALLAALSFGSCEIGELYDPLVTETVKVRFPTGGDLDNVLDSLAASGAVPDTALVRRAIGRRDFKYRSGQFRLDSAWSAADIAKHIDVGGQAEARVILTNARTLGNMAANATRFIELDSAELHEALLDPAWLDSVGYTPQTVIAIAIPNTYNVYWDVTAAELRERLLKEQSRFWDRDGRRARADSLGLTPTEVYTLASIVESETKHKPEKPTVAGVYLNRLDRGMALQADPTVVFAMGDFTLRRVLLRHLEYDSPYNTYLYPGLPPGPIAMASISSIDAVLRPEDHDYYFFVTKGDGSRTHAFARDMRGHSRNIRKFQETLRARGIRR